jgi:glycosyltransferase involved in cell wall biosynthesis
MKQLKLLFVIDSLGTGGAERDLAERLPELARFGIAPIVVSLRQRADGVQRDLQRQGFDLRILKNTGLLSQVLALRKIIRDERPDLIRTVLFRADLAGRLAAIGSRTKLLSKLVSTEYAEIRRNDPNLNRMKFRLARLLDGWTARYLTTHIHANSNAVKAAAIRDLRIPPAKITVIEGAREPHRLGQPGAARRRRARLRLGLEEGQEVLVNVGRQDYPKGQRYLLEAVGKLIPAHPHLVLLVAGRSGDVSPNLERLHQQLCLGKHVRFLGHRNDVPDILASADLFVFPSLYEGLPGAVIEAMALGLPVVASDIDPVRETVQEGRNAILVEPACSVALAMAIERLLEDHETARVFARRSREIFEERFTLERSMAREIELYHRLLSLQ